jgi:hypothetical protein
MVIIDDPVPKVRQTVAFVYYKISEFVPQLIFDNEQYLQVFIQNCLNHCEEHHLISALVVGALKNLFINGAKLNKSCMLNGYFHSVFTKLFE